MATINGITIKSYRTFSGIEYPTIRECTVWKDGKKIGTFREDEWGGESHYDRELEEIVRPSALQYQSGCPDGRYKEFEANTDSFICHLLTLAEYEKFYKKNCKNGKPYTLFIGNRDYYIAFNSTISMINRIDKSEVISKSIKKNFPKGYLYAWEVTSPSDFVLTVDKDHPVPKYISMGV